MRGRMLARFFVCCVCLACLGAAGTAEAQPRPGAREHFEAGATAYGQARYQDALVEFQAAYAIEPLPELLFNIGQCHDRLRQDREAIDAFRRYAEQAPNGQDREVALERARLLEEALRAREQPRPPTPTPEPEPEPAPVEPVDARGPGALPWVVIGGSAAVGIAGAIFLALGQSDNASIEGAMSGADWSDYESAYDRGPLFSNLGLAMIGVGAAGIAIGFVLLGSGGGDGEDGDARSASVSFGVGSLELRGTF